MERKISGSRITVLAILLTIFSLSVVYTVALETTTMQTSSISAYGDVNKRTKQNVLEIINTERWRENTPKLQLREAGLAQRHAQAVLEENEIYHNRDLPCGVAETVLLTSYNHESVDLIVVNLLVSGLMSNKPDRKLLLGSEFNSAEIGVAYTDYRVCLVIDYYEREIID